MGIERTRTLLLGLTALCRATGPASAQSPPTALDAVSAKAGFSGILGLRKDGVQVHLASYSRPDVGGATMPDRVVRWASVTKMGTAVLVMQQVEAGRRALDAPVSRYLSY